MIEKGGHVNVCMLDDLGRSEDLASPTSTFNSVKQDSGTTVSFHHIHYKVQMKGGCCGGRGKTPPREILVDLNGVMRAGLNAIMGPTGCGKTSFLDILAARKDPLGLSGDVLIEGAPMPDNFKTLSGYVVQDDLVMGTLTVRENMLFSAALRLPSSISEAEKNARVSQLIKELGLSKVADSKVGSPLLRGVSGGERKRAAIGMEMIIDPLVLFLDEPTTGLDANTAASVLLLLKRMAMKGRTIIMSIHQPRYSIYRLFDSLTLLVAGKMVYHGPSDQALDYFNDLGYTCEPHDNPADFFLDVLNGGYDSSSMAKKQGSEEEEDLEEMKHCRNSTEDHMVESYKSSSSCADMQAELARITQERQNTEPPPPSGDTYSCSFRHQLHWVLWRTFHNLLLNPQTSVAQLGMNCVLAIIVGIIFLQVKNDQSGIQNRVGALFFTAINQCFSCMSAAELFILERKLFIHEHISGYYSVVVYFLSRAIADLILLRTLPVIVYCTISYFMIGLKKTAGAFFFHLLTVLLVTYASSALTMTISADQTVVSVANLYITVTVTLMIMFSGVMVNLPSMGKWLMWLKYFSIPRYCMEALQINEFRGLLLCEELSQNSSAMNNGGILCTGEEFLDFLGMENTTWGLWQNIVAMVLLGIIFFFITYLKLRFSKKYT